MPRVVDRFARLLTGSFVGAVAVGIREGSIVRGVVTHGGVEHSSLSAFVATLAVLTLPALVVAACVYFVAALVDGYLDQRERPFSIGGIAAATPLVVVGTSIWAIFTAHIASVVLAEGTPARAGFSLAIATVLVAFAVGAVMLALWPTIFAWAARAEERGQRGRLLGANIGVLCVVGAALGYGIVRGETSGARGVVGILGVLRRPELDLRAVTHGLVIVVLAATTELGGRLVGARLSADHRLKANRISVWALGLGLLGALALLVHAGRGFGGGTAIAAAIRQDAPLGGRALAVLQRAYDRDGDGYSRLFGGGDCNDRDPRIHPGAIEILGNGIDENCSGTDVALAEGDADRAQSRTVRVDEPYNVLLITVDALRSELGFAGNPRPISPNLDALAARSTVFEHAYAMASMTWQSLGSLMIGRYPSEIGGYERFNHFTPQQVLVTERLRDAGVRTFAAMCQFAFSKPRPMDVARAQYAHIGHGFSIWDTSADPDPNGFNYEDRAVTSDKLTDVMIGLLSRPENVAPESGRFFAWAHYFDPHTQYVQHPESPDFSTPDSSDIGRDRATYESEVWFADHHIGRLIEFVNSQRFGARTAIIVTGDHGEAFGEHGMRWHRRELWQELVHVPLIIFVPGQAPKRVTVRRSHIDLARTILDLTGVPAPADDSVRGVSLLFDVMPRKGYVPVPRDVYAEIVPSENPVRHALISGPGNGIKIVERNGTEHQLFELDSDPGEKTNRAPTDHPLLLQHIDRLARFRGTLQTIPYHGPVRD